MNIRNYNIYFNTHTISGIIICALLYVIFFAGSFSFFRDEISAWQKGTSYTAYKIDGKSYDKLLDSLSHEMNLQGRDIAFYLYQGGARSYVNVSASVDSVVNNQSLAKSKSAENKKAKGRRGGGDTKYFNYDFVTKEAGEYSKSYDLAEFLYRLHFLAQLNEVPIRIGIAPFGYLIAGITAFIFLFALITGLLLHWDKIVSNFFIFRPFSKWKTVWTDMHTALGVIGFPFQFLYAVTGIFLIINAVLALPFGKLLYNGDTDKMYEDLGYSRTLKYEYTYSPLQHIKPISEYIAMANQKWPDAHIHRLFIKNYGDESMHILIELEPRYTKNFSGSGILNVRAADEEVVLSKSPDSDQTYIDTIKSLIYRLHYGDYGGYPLKIVYFLLGIMGCLVITSGILIWLVARDKNNVIPRKRKFNSWMANFFMAICLSMFPVTAFTFIVVKWSGQADQSFIYNTFFWSWLGLSFFYTVRKSIKRTNLETLLIGSILSLTLPLVNGFVSNNWIWNTVNSQHIDIMLVDALWILIGVVGLIAYTRSRVFFSQKPM